MTFLFARLRRLSLISTAALAACGGGGGDAGTPVTSPPTVTAVTVAPTAMYSSTLTVTLTGANLLNGLAVASTGCSNMTISSISPYISSSTTAYYQCTVSAVGDEVVTVNATADGTLVGSAGFTVATPQVTMAVSNTAGGGVVSGTLVVTLDPTQAPITVTNFLSYVNSGFYIGTIFHRLTTTATDGLAVLQGGGYASPVSATADPSPKATNAPIPLEVNSGLSNVQWTLAMARTNVSDSATSQFFINLADNSAALDPNSQSAGFAVFGSLSAGTDVATAMAGAPCQQATIDTFSSGPSGCLPIPNLVITGAVQTQ